MVGSQCCARGQPLCRVVRTSLFPSPMAQSDKEQRESAMVAFCRKRQKAGLSLTTSQAQVLAKHDALQGVKKAAPSPQRTADDSELPPKKRRRSHSPAPACVAPSAQIRPDSQREQPRVVSLSGIKRSRVAAVELPSKKVSVAPDHQPRRVVSLSNKSVVDLPSKKEAKLLVEAKIEQRRAKFAAPTTEKKSKRKDQAKVPSPSEKLASVIMGGEPSDWLGRVKAMRPAAAAASGPTGSWEPLPPRVPKK